MKRLALVSIMLLASTAIAAPPTSPAATHAWTGVYEIKSPGKPGMTITLVDDTGVLTGTIVFEVFNKETGERIDIVPRTIVNPHLDRDALAFQVLRISKPHLRGAHNPLDPGPEQLDPPDPVDMSLSTPADGKTMLTCAKCGQNAPAVLEKLR